MAGRSNRSRFAYLNYDEIQTAINNSQLDAYDIIYTKDTHENIIITPDLDIISVGSRIYRFPDTATAETYLNMATDTYEGQIISIAYDGHYVAYIVNKNTSDHFYVTPLNAYEGELDYDELQHRPVSNLTGTLNTPVVLDGLSTGVYKVSGQYKISESLDTVFSSSAGTLYLVEHTQEDILVRKISASDITDYKIKNGEITTSTVPTSDWLKEQGYITENKVDEKLAALDFVNKKDIENYVSQVVLATIDSLVDEKIDTALNERIQIATEKEALDAFTTVFNKE